MSTVHLAATSDVMANVTLSARQVMLCRQTTVAWVSGDLCLLDIAMCVADDVGTRQGTDHGLHGSLSSF